MDILWPAIGIGVIVGFIFFVLAQHWRKILGQHAWTIRRLTERVRDLEDMTDPEFRRRLGEASPMPLEQVFTLTFRLNDRFWRDALHMTDENLRFIHEFGSFVGSVKLDRWRSHTVATVAEVLPDHKESGWRMRSHDFYPDPAKPGRGLTLVGTGARAHEIFDGAPAFARTRASRQFHRSARISRAPGEQRRQWQRR